MLNVSTLNSCGPEHVSESETVCLPSSGSRGRLWEGVCRRGPSLQASSPALTTPPQIYGGRRYKGQKLEHGAVTVHLEDSQLLFMMASGSRVVVQGARCWAIRVRASGEGVQNKFR